MARVELAPAGDLTGRTIIVTGASSGLGKVAATTFATLGATVAVVGRNRERTEAVAKEIGGKAFIADYGQLAQVRSLGEALLAEYPEIHGLANNAGGLVSKRALTDDGNERTFQESHLGGFLLTSILLPRLTETAASVKKAGGADGTVRIVQTSSSANLMGRVDFDDLDTLHGPWLAGWRAYGTAKLENILFTRELARRTRGTGISTYAFHPGFVGTNFGSDSIMVPAIKVLTGGAAALSPEQGAEPLIRLIATPTVPAPSGNFFDRLKAPGRTAPQVNDADVSRRLWRESERRVG
jgi:NAD(P)-dependent dehydrogenase (short-subunit alcohol dehydrogenase family)